MHKKRDSHEVRCGVGNPAGAGYEINNGSLLEFHCPARHLRCDRMCHFEGCSREKGRHRCGKIGYGDA